VKISLDFETRSEADLRKVGAHLYACHPSTQAICLAFAFDQDEEVHLWHRRFDTVEQGTGKQRHAVSIPEQRPAALEELFERIRNGELLWAWNAEFERLIWQHVMVPQHGWPTVPLEQWRCSAAQAASYALPRSLHAAGKALGVKEQKLVDEGKSNLLMLKLAKPRKARKAECRAAGVADADEYRAKRGVLWWEIEDELRGLFSYCQQDVRAERAISETLRPLPEIEQKTWLLDQKINDRGVKCDLELVAAARQHIAAARAEAEEEIRRLTGGAVASTTRRTELLQWLHEQGVRIPDTAAESIDAALEKDDAALRDPAVRRVLVVWRASHKTSLAKYASMRERTGEDGRIRGNFKYHGSSTGRWAATGRVQLQNLPRGKVANMDRACDSILRLSTDELNLEYGNVLELLSGTIRGAICAPSGRKLCVGDFSSIEARGVFWLAGQRDALQVLASGEDIYKDMASSIYGVPVERVSSAQRHVGKTIVLGGLYQMGPPKFQRVCGAQGSPIPLDGLEVIEQLRGPKAVAWFVREYGEDAQEASELWRQEHAPDTVTAVSVVRAFRGKYDRVPRLWRDLEMAAIEAVTRGPGAPAVRMQKGLQWAVRGRFLHCRLPSGRLLSYCDPFVKFERTPWGKVKPRLRFWGLGRTRKWEEQDTYGGALCENVVQGLCRDLLRDALLRLDAEGYSIVTHTHDEAMCEEPESEDLDRFLKLMGKNPSWARGFPLSAEGWSGKRYRK